MHEDEEELKKALKNICIKCRWNTSIDDFVNELLSKIKELNWRYWPNSYHDVDDYYKE